ncbi:MAG: hypothetical protein HOB84_15770 [Candidatus Marinimicrobia bacterium]|jgi:lysophospholipase L1-like esterase|nr:hypothetical protein [Candidatus Neomarinimicrobiota bacterium]MBT4359826.1 hypothetical protein [Candidatus Neomarinimicrobiota bacterium]MBT4716226.1 hypothetical protein [Candidatus Neomarinimicrobiota bacterium]MBT4944636.1 hypothetical protein [Candidatus Neomarinimicrobiota bacterium]MBT5268278.1 hypothetical protein [Candidatus Neomarinimicrobiota bacterium]
MISKIVFFGDSITAASRTILNPLGNGYVSILKELFLADSGLGRIQFVNSGVNGHMVGDLLNRYQADVMDHKPNAVVIKIGINDAYNDFIAGGDRKQIQNYATGLDKLIHNLQAGLPKAQFSLFTPYLISDSNSEIFYLRMSEYCDVVKSLGDKYSIPVLDLQSVFDTAVKQKPAREWAEDQIHPQHDGHALIARAAFTFLKEHPSKS